MENSVHIVFEVVRRVSGILVLLSLLICIAPAKAAITELGATNAMAIVPVTNNSHLSALAEPLNIVAACIADQAEGQAKNNCMREGEVEVKNAIWLFLTAIVGFIFLINRRS